MGKREIRHSHDGKKEKEVEGIEQHWPSSMPKRKILYLLESKLKTSSATEKTTIPAVANLLPDVKIFFEVPVVLTLVFDFTFGALAVPCKDQTSIFQ